MSIGDELQYDHLNRYAKNFGNRNHSFRDRIATSTMVETPTADEMRYKILSVAEKNKEFLAHQNELMLELHARIGELLRENKELKDKIKEPSNG